MSSDLLKKATSYVKVQFGNEPTGHDWYHIERVLRMARKLQAVEGGNLELIEILAVLHDLGDYKNYDFDEKKAQLVLKGMMDIIEVPTQLQSAIIDIVTEIQYRGRDTKKPTSLEAKIIQDADWLDSVGAIGIARIFSTGGRIRRMIHDPKRKPRMNLSSDDYILKKREGTSFNYFYEKTLNLPKILNTDTAKNIAKERIKFLKIYMNQFLEEWEGLK